MIIDVTERAAGCLAGTAYGDALGVPYEYGSRPLPPLGRVFGGGLAACHVALSQARTSGSVPADSPAG